LADTDAGGHVGGSAVRTSTSVYLWGWEGICSDEEKGGEGENAPSEVHASYCLFLSSLQARRVSEADRDEPDKGQAKKGGMVGAREPALASFHELAANKTKDNE